MDVLLDFFGNTPRNVPKARRYVIWPVCEAPSDPQMLIRTEHSFGFVNSGLIRQLTIATAGYEFPI